MKYTYNIYNDIYYLMLTGKKDIEIRLLNDKSLKISEGDFITFNNLSCEGRYIKTKVKRKSIYNNIDEVVINNNINRILPGSSKENLVKLLIQIFGDKVNNSKIVAFEFELIDSDLDIKVYEFSDYAN